MTHKLEPSTMHVWTLTVDDPNAAGIQTSVHASEEIAIAFLRSQFDPEGNFTNSEDVVQSFCDNGFVIYIDEHAVEIPVVVTLSALKTSMTTWRDQHPTIADYRIEDGVNGLTAAHRSLDHFDRGEQTPEWRHAIATHRDTGTGA